MDPCPAHWGQAQDGGQDGPPRSRDHTRDRGQDELLLPGPRSGQKPGWTPTPTPGTMLGTEDRMDPCPAHWGQARDGGQDGAPAYQGHARDRSQDELPLPGPHSGWRPG